MIILLLLDFCAGCTVYEGELVLEYERHLTLRHSPFSASEMRGGGGSKGQSNGRTFESVSSSLGRFPSRNDSSCNINTDR
jgi:hypothetical protein